MSGCASDRVYTDVQQFLAHWGVVFFSLMFLAIAAAIFYGIAKHFFVRYRSQRCCQLCKRVWHILKLSEYALSILSLCSSHGVTVVCSASALWKLQSLQETVPLLLVPSKSPSANLAVDINRPLPLSLEQRSSFLGLPLIENSSELATAIARWYLTLC